MMNKKILIFSFFVLLMLFIVSCREQITQQTQPTTTLQEPQDPGAMLTNDMEDLNDTISGLEDSSLDDLEDFSDL
ncbi:hypothetical protein J4214_00560 [Candidatus Woesearchaeota archaeon]|nr:hypothetical protein [Candidatus Woesearchaeota archaeon]